MPHSITGLSRAIGRLPRIAGRVPSRVRRPLVAAMLCAALVCAALLWFRDSSFARVEEATVTGLTTPDAPRLRAALVDAARDMSTLHVRVGELERAASPFPVVKSVEAEPDFPHGLRIRVIEHRPVAALMPAAGGSRLLVAADGTALRGLEVDHPLPILTAGGLPAGDRVSDRPTMRALRAVATAPPGLERRILTVVEDPSRGVVARLRRGPEVVLGGLTRLRAKWDAAALVLTDPAADGVAYVDVRLPDRPVAGDPEPSPDRSSAERPTDSSTTPGEGSSSPGENTQP